MHDITTRLQRFFASPWLWYATLGFFAFEALWFVFSALYPMAFDEDFHFGIITIYSQQWLPFLDGQPANADAYGSLATDPSYLYHYLMSFPLRVVRLFTESQTIQIIWLRLLNVAMVLASLVLFKKVMAKAGASPALITVSMLVFALIPIAPQLAAHINYDNLLMLLLAMICLVVFRLVEGFRQQRIDTLALAQLVALCLFTSLVKYAALPLLVGVVLFVGIMAWRHFRQAPRKAWKTAVGAARRMSRPLQVGLLAVLVIGGVLFAQRYVVNTLTYHHPVPDCGKVLTVEQCQHYGPWGRDHNFEQSRDPAFQPDTGYFMGEWLKGMRHRLFFAVSGAKTGFMNYIELPVPVATFTVLFVLAVVAVIAWWRQLFRGQAYLVFFALMIGIYVLVLWIDQYGMYKQTAVPVAINGRYLIPIFPLLAVIAGRAFGLALARFKAANLKPYLAAAVLLLFLQGGGVFTFILRSDDSWYWPNQAVTNINHAARSLAAPLIIEGDKFANWH